MKPAATLGLYAGGLALVFAAAFGVGGAVGPVGTAGVSTPAHSTDNGADMAEHSADVEPGPYELRADVRPAGRGRALTLAADLTATATRSSSH